MSNYSAFSPMRLPLLLLALILSVGLTAPAFSAEEEGEPSKTLTEAGAESVRKAYEFIEADKYQEAIVELSKMLAKAKPGTYDYCVGNLLTAQSYLNLEKFAEATRPLEIALDAGYFDEEAYEKYLTTLVHLYYTENQFDKAEQRLQAFLLRQPNPTHELLFFYATILYQQKKYPESLNQIERAMRAQLKVEERFFQLAVACAQEVKQYQKAIGYLEALVEMQPTKDIYWTQLYGTYLAVDNPQAALITLDRAQARGFLKTPQHNITRIQLLYNLDQYERAATLLDKGLLDGSVESTQRNWELLAYCYKQMYREDKTREVLERAASTTIWSAIDLQLAELNWQGRRYRETIQNLNSAIKKGNLAKPGDVYLLMASAYFELGDFTKSEECLVKAEENPDLKSKVESLRNAIRAYEERRQMEEEQKALEARRGA